MSAPTRPPRPVAPIPHPGLARAGLPPAPPVAPKARALTVFECFLAFVGVTCSSVVLVAVVYTIIDEQFLQPTARHSAPAPAPTAADASPPSLDQADASTLVERP